MDASFIVLEKTNSSRWVNLGCQCRDSSSNWQTLGFKIALRPKKVGFPVGNSVDDVMGPSGDDTGICAAIHACEAHIRLFAQETANLDHGVSINVQSDFILAVDGLKARHAAMLVPAGLKKEIAGRLVSETPDVASSAVSLP